MDKRIGFQVRSLNNLLKRNFESYRSREIEFPTGVHGWAIGYFYNNRDKDIFQRDFESHFSIRRSTATRILQLMEKNGLVIRTAVSTDARLKKISLTDKAVAIHEAVINHLDELETQLKKGISQSELDIFFSVIDKIKANLEVKND